MASSRVLKVPRSDDPDAYVLVNVSQKGKAGLDLRLAATEGENPYITTSMFLVRLRKVHAIEKPVVSLDQTELTLMISV